MTTASVQHENSVGDTEILVEHTMDGMYLRSKRNKVKKKMKKKKNENYVKMNKSLGDGTLTQSVSVHSRHIYTPHSICMNGQKEAIIVAHQQAETKIFIIKI